MLIPWGNVWVSMLYSGVWYGTLRKQFNCQAKFTLPRTF